MTINEFWTVYGPIAAVLQKQHGTLRAAQEEAQRLAKLHPGETFSVLEIVDAYCTPADVSRVAVMRGGE